MEFNLRWKTILDGRQILMEDDIWWKTTFDGRWPLMEYDIRQKTTFDRRQPMTEDDLWQKTTFDKRRPLTENNLWQKTTFDRKQPLTKDNLWRKTSFDGRQLSIGLQYITWKKCLRLLTLTATAQLTQIWKSYQLSTSEVEFHMMEEIYAALCMCTCAEKMAFLGKND